MGKQCTCDVFVRVASATQTVKEGLETVCVGFLESPYAYGRTWLNKPSLLPLVENNPRMIRLNPLTFATAWNTCRWVVNLALAISPKQIPNTTITTAMKRGRYSMSMFVLFVALR